MALWLKEGNTQTTTLYKPRTEDTPFLFFTDDIVWARPALGIANALWGAAHSIVELVQLPLRGTTQFKHSMQGIFYSLPELIFFNIRKGTYLYDDIHEGAHEL